MQWNKKKCAHLREGRPRRELQLHGPLQLSDGDAGGEQDVGARHGGQEPAGRRVVPVALVELHVGEDQRDEVLTRVRHVVGQAPRAETHSTRPGTCGKHNSPVSCWVPTENIDQHLEPNQVNWHLQLTTLQQLYNCNSKLASLDVLITSKVKKTWYDNESTSSIFFS